jgi:hypothetical protein
MEPFAPATLLRGYLLPLALLAPVATVIGMSMFDRNWDPVHGFLVRPEWIFPIGAATYAGIVGSVILLAAILSVIAPLFGGVRDFSKALAVATYGSVPVLLAGAFMILPVMALVGLVALGHSLHLMWLGARRLLQVPGRAGAEFIGVCIVVMAVLSIFVGAGVGAFLSD